MATFKIQFFSQSLQFLNRYGGPDIQINDRNMLVVFFMDLLYLICYYPANENRFKVSNKKQY